MKYKIEIHETSSRVIEIEANTEEEALGIVEQQYENSDIVLGTEDFQDYTITAI